MYLRKLVMVIMESFKYFFCSKQCFVIKKLTEKPCVYSQKPQTCQESQHIMKQEKRIQYNLLVLVWKVKSFHGKGKRGEHGHAFWDGVFKGQTDNNHYRVSVS